jgi:hypothetical protein
MTRTGRQSEICAQPSRRRLQAPSSRGQATAAWLFGGTMQVQVAGGSNVASALFGLTAGSATLAITHAGSTIGGGRTATGG